MPRRVTNDPGDAACGAALVARWGRHRRWRLVAHAWAVVVEDEDAFVLRVHGARHTHVGGAEEAIRIVGLLRPPGRARDLTRPGPVLPVRRRDHPFLPQRVPPLLPDVATFEDFCHAGEVRALGAHT